MAPGYIDRHNEVPPINDLIFVIEDTALNSSCIDELYQEYIVPTLEHFNDGASKDPFWASVECTNTFSLVLFKSSECFPGSTSVYRGPFVTIKEVMASFDSISFAGGMSDFSSCGAEGVAQALYLFDTLEKRRESYLDPNVLQSKYLIFIANSVAHDLPVMDVPEYQGLVLDDLTKKIVERNIYFSVFSTRKLPFLCRLYCSTGGDLTPYKEKSFAADPSHLILLSGFELTPHPIHVATSLSPPLSIESQQSNQIGVQAIVAQQQQNQMSGTMHQTAASPYQTSPASQIGSPVIVSSAGGTIPAQGGLQNQMQNVQGMRDLMMTQQQQQQQQQQQRPIMAANQSLRMPNPRMTMQQQQWQNPGTAMQPNQSEILRARLNQRAALQQQQQQQQQQQMQQNDNTTLKTLLHQPPQGIQQQQQQAMNRMNTPLLQQQQQGQMGRGMMVNPMQRMQTPMSVMQGGQQMQVQAGVKGREIIWSGELSWSENTTSGPSKEKITHIVKCQVTCSSENGIPEVRADSWPPRLIMQLIPKNFIQSIGGQFLRNAKAVVFMPEPSESLDVLTRVLQGTNKDGYAGCVHFTTPGINSQPCDIKVLILFYAQEKKSYLGFIPTDQMQFVERIRQVIQQQKSEQKGRQILLQQQQQIPVGASGVPMSMSSSGPMTMTMTGGTMTMANVNQGNLVMVPNHQRLLMQNQQGQQGGNLRQILQQPQHYQQMSQQQRMQQMNLHQQQMQMGQQQQGQQQPDQLLRDLLN